MTIDKHPVDPSTPTPTQQPGQHEQTKGARSSSIAEHQTATGANDQHSSGTHALAIVGNEISAVLSAVSERQLTDAAATLVHPNRRWFCSGQGRSGLVAHMAAMRLMHLGLDAYSVGESTAPAISEDDGLLMISGSGETPITLHLARLGLGFGATLLAITTRPDSTLGRLAHTTVEVPATATRQFGGSLFEQAALVFFDAVVLHITNATPETYRAMTARHTNLQ